MNSDEANVSKLQEEIEASLKKNLLFERLIYVGGTLGIVAPLAWLSIHYKFSPLVAAFLALFGVSLILLFVKRYNLKRKVTSQDAAKYMDDRFSLKERALSNLELEEKNPKDTRAAFIKGQIASLAPKKIEVPNFRFQKTSILLISILPIPWIFISWIFLSQSLETKNSSEVKLLEELIKSEKNIPDALKNSLEELGEALSKEDINSEEVKAALSRSEKALKEAIEGKEGAKSDSIEVSETPGTEASPTPTATPTPMPQFSPTPPSSEEKKESDKDQKANESKSQDDSKKDDKSQKQDGSSKSTDESKEGDSKDQKQKDGGQGKGGASDKKSEGKDSKEGQGQGKGESESKQESKSLEGVGKALEEIKEKSESQQQEKNNQGEKGDKQSDKEQSQSEESQKGEKGQGDKKEGEQQQNKEKKDSKGSGQGEKQQSEEQKEQDKKENKEKSKDESKGEDKAAEAQNKKESDDQKGGEDKKQVGEKGEGEKASSLPQGSELVPTPQGSGNESEGGPKTLKDVSVPGEDETLDTRFMGDTKERVKNEKGGESKVSLSDVKLSKPDENGTGENQYVPPEYSEILK